MQNGGGPAFSVPGASAAVVSVIVVGDGPPDAAIRSVLRQTLAAIEVIVAAPGAAALATSRGRWVCWLDAGDMMHPRRLQDLVRLAEADGCDIVADTMLRYRDTRAPTPSLAAFAGSRLVDAAGYAGRFAGRVRPMIRWSLLHGSLLDDGDGGDPVPRLLAGGAVFRVYPHLTYFHGKAAVTKRAGGRSVAVLSRQRLTGRSSGSSAYLLSLCEALRDAGLTLHLISPSPATFGRWPAIRMGAEMGVFASVVMRGAWRIGPFLVAHNPQLLLRAGLTVLGQALAQVRLTQRLLSAPAPYAVGLPVSRGDRLFAARHLAAGADFILVDYAFLTDLIAYGPELPSLVVMHDLFSSRAAQFARIAGQDSTITISEEAELGMLSLAGAVLAIQPDEAAMVAQSLPQARVITAPMGVHTVAGPQPGDAGLLFVGSAAAPNVDGLRWFLGEVWPLVRRAEPRAVLTVAGAVGRGLGAVPRGVSVVGRVADLTPAYRTAAVVIAPLRAGSGLKIKLIEAMAHGKAIVATSVTVQGVEAVTQGAAIVADDPADFARAIVSLLQDPALRGHFGAAALAVARAHFSPAAGYRAFVEHVVAAKEKTKPE